MHSYFCVCVEWAVLCLCTEGPGMQVSLLASSYHSWAPLQTHRPALPPLVFVCRHLLKGVYSYYLVPLFIF